MQNAKLYSELTKRRHDRCKQISEIWKEHESLFQWTHGETVLDVGCGPGDVTASLISSWLQPDFQLLVGADVSPSVINHAVSHNAMQKLTFVTMDIEGDISHFLQKKEFSEGFNKIFSFFAFHWLHDLEKGVENLRRLLKPGAQVLLYFPIDRMFQKTFKEINSREPWSTYLKDVCREIPIFPVTPDPSFEFRNMLVNAGFEVIKCEERELIDKYYISDLKDLIESVAQDLEFIPTNLKGEYLQDCYGILAAMGVINISEQTVIFKKSTLLVVARNPCY